MKRYKNKLIALLISVVALTSFTACENEDYVVRSALYCSFGDITDTRDGYFEDGGKRVYTFNDIPNLGHADVVGMDYLGTTMTISGNFQPGDVIRDLYIDVQDVGEFLYSSRIDVNGTTMRFDTYKDPEFYDFMSEAMYDFYRKGWTNIIVSGFVTTRSGIPIGNVRINVTLDNSLDVSMR